MTETNIVLITGFGPFGEHRINASWEAVSALPDRINEFDIIKQQIPVSYTYVEKNIPLLWQQYNPKLVIHVGVSSHTKVIQIETRANKTGYKRLDIENTCPVGGQACFAKETDEDCIITELSARKICEKLNSHPHLKAALSNDPGRYLCEYIYYVSLNQDKKRSLFIHVPPLNDPFSKTQLAHALEEIIKCALELISEQDTRCECPKSSARIYKNGRAATAF